MSVAEHRRNGKAASCEPCRKGKIRCDHQRPVCGRCKRRGLVTRCFYHPAPLTRPRTFDEEATATRTSNRTRSYTPTASPPRTAVAPDTSINAAPLSRPSAISHGVQTLSLPWSPMTPNSQGQLLPPHGRPSFEGPFREERLRPVKDLLRHLSHYRFIQKLLVNYGLNSQAANVPAPILNAFGESLTQTASKYSLDGTVDEVETCRLVNDVLRNTSKPISVTPDLDWKRFVALFTGDNLRLEAVGLMYALTARACLLGLAWDDDKREDFVHALRNASATCLNIVREIAPNITDVLLWHSFDHVRLCTHIDGDASLAVYRRLGELSTDVFECGIHRESTITADTPVFLAECKRRTFAACYHIDKFVSTLIDRPPRIPKRYSDCKMPLDLADHDLLAEPAALEAAKRKLTIEGWNSAGHYVPTSWQRVRYMLGILREEIHEFQIQPSSQENTLNLRDLARRCRESQESLPSHLRYDPQCWHSGLSVSICLMLTVLHLNYLQNYFQVQRLLAKSDIEASTVVLQVSAESLATVLQIGTHLNRAIFMVHDFPYVVLCYGLPAAAILMTTLQNVTKSSPTGTESSLPPGLSRSTLLRHLSVFISHLDSICSPGDGNYELCIQASKVLSRILDEILDTPNASSSSTFQETPDLLTASNANVATQANTDNMSVMMDMDNFADNGEDLDGIDLAAWVKSIDWTSIGGEFSTV
ncbi:transcription factor C6 like [Lecanosticta acicola]|uniref:Transcription factor C6 like n=1 Tax=Lecanosticta acicola TaxID=111012 RepID=A0AAI9E7K0_9PEZI|nr:transcription factor C6 like [Lecanosticta acicola]